MSQITSEIKQTIGSKNYTSFSTNLEGIHCIRTHDRVNANRIVQILEEYKIKNIYHDTTLNFVYFKEN